MATIKKLEKLYKKYYFRLQGLLFDKSTENIRRVVETHINFALEKNKAFDALYSCGQYGMARSIHRMVAECCMRAYGHLYENNETTFRVANKTVRGFRMQDIPAGGKQLTDRVLKERIAKEYPIVAEAYESGNDTVHVGNHYYDSYAGVDNAEQVRDVMVKLNETLLEILARIIGNTHRYFPLTFSNEGQEMMGAELLIKIESIDPSVEFNAKGWLSLATIKRYILDTQLQFGKLYNHHIQKAEALGEKREDVMNIIMRPIIEELNRCHGYSKIIAAIEEKYGNEVLAGYMATWMNIRIENTPGIGPDMTRMEPIYELSEIRAEYNEEWKDMGARVLKDIDEDPEKYPKEFIEAVINTKNIKR